ncbi:MAG: FAD/NAD(P)-binding oxidoreductase [Chloroflexi bacterium]|nr:FAD/NAD(P)-binding oxidoreductase [Chloroflexota bacterium]MDA1228858.1 FAD/NAD(P)-binding oxidoreductase [Chloroflexota bacterium]
MATTIVLGGGVGGLVTARELRKKLGREHRVILIDKEARHIFWPSLLWLQVGLRKPAAIQKDLAPLEKKGIEVIKGEVEAIDPQQKTVRVDGQEFQASYIVVSLGAQLAPEELPGLQEVGHNLYSLEGATAIRDARIGLTSGRLVVLVARMPFKCPAAPYEAAMLLEHDLKKRNVRQNVSVALYTPEAGPMGVAGPTVSAGVRNIVEGRGIEYYPQHQVTSVDGTTGTLRFANDTEAHFDFLAYIPPHIAPPVVRDAGLTGESGWVPVDRHTMETSFQDVYAIGDVTGIPLSMGLPLPKAGVFAHGEGIAVAQTIASKITGRGEAKTFEGNGECFIEIGGGKAGFGKGNFYAEPAPVIKLHQPSWYRHWGKVLFEKYWMWRWV